SDIGGDPARCENRDNMFIASRDGKQIKPVLIGAGINAIDPAWSPDGKLLALHEMGTLTIIQPNGKGLKKLTDNPITCPHGIAWSPDSLRIAWIGGICNSSGGQPDTVWVINRDGTAINKIYKSDDTELVDGQIAWSPDGKSVAAAAMESGVVYLIDASCATKPNGCDETSRTTIGRIPEHWMRNFYPQWAGEKVAQSPANEPTTTSTPYPTSVPDSLFIPAISQGKKFTAAANGIYRFTIKDGAILNCPSGANPNDPQCGTWTTFLTVFKNREILWMPNPASWDFSIGKNEPSDTQEQAVSIGADSYTDIPLYNNEYVMIVANDCVNCYDDNLGGIQLAISIVGAAP
ncbi:MAG: hypothetical protein MUO77_01150, partial [Anaerolineales bacterium]|nr:hypothetical protein [Anaerolineales bacterium]